MTRHLVIFAATFAIGAVIAVILRTGSHRPYAGHSLPPAPAAAPAAVTPPSAHQEPAKATAVNSICAICAMPVDPKLGTIMYKGRPIGFGCKACPPKFQAEPEKYGEAALKNQVVE